MAPQRRSNRKSGPAATGSQSTISFGGPSKVVKPVESTKITKDGKASNPIINTKSLPLTDSEPEVSPAVIISEVPVETRGQAPKSKEELAARKITDGRIKKYWASIEAERKAKRVHQDKLTINERILRHFDISSQYGPCIGSDRTKRWERASRLDLEPPIEVLAVLLKENAIEPGQSERAYIDELMV
ncbi:MAG: hypothetical protein M1814_001939 [Vezdaea aestivalis]|nr:MAG: hypothetical protein M1814_001939 [Vezdaea aestivalis]